MTHEACSSRGLALEPISATQIAAGGLSHARLLVVPGGYSSLKKKALGRRGAQAIRDFVEHGGRYLGFCGGAGLALSVPDGLGLVKLGRAQGSQRLPGLSGSVRVRVEPGAEKHHFWRGQDQPGQFHVWWPGQFQEPSSPEIIVLARYQEAGPDLYIADLEVNQTDPSHWPGLEAAYGMALDPDCLWGQPAAISARLGKGRLLLTYLHLDTKGCRAGELALKSLWRRWLGDDATRRPAPPAEPGPQTERAAALANKARELWDLGRELGLWQPRHPAMPRWQRGARGLEFWSLLRLCEAMAVATPSTQDAEQIIADLETALEPVFKKGPAVLWVQAARLVGREPEPRNAKIEAAWFPAPRRVGSDLAAGLEALEEELLKGLSSR
jgi:glutamine amidotransferase-like uncharacterized protein